MRKTKTLHGNAYLYEAKLKAEEKFFSKEELNKILSFYGVRVASGEWRDYAIDRDEEKSSFSIYRHTSEMPLYKIIKSHKIKSFIASLALTLKTAGFFRSRLFFCFSPIQLVSQTTFHIFNF